MSVTPESDKTVSLTSQRKEDPTPKNEFKKPINQRSYFNSPTDALVSPCTQKLMQQRRLPRNVMVGSQKPRYEQCTSSLAEKENKVEPTVPSNP